MQTLKCLIQNAAIGMMAIALIPSGVVFAEDTPMGPVKAAAESWYKNNITYQTLEGAMTYYSPDKEFSIVVFNSTDGGNITFTDIAVFRKNKDGQYTFLKKATPPKGLSQDVAMVEFAPSGATIATPVWRPSDPRCCPTGTKAWRLDLP